MDDDAACFCTISFDANGKRIATDACQPGVCSCSKKIVRLRLPLVETFTIHQHLRALKDDEIRLFVLCPGSETALVGGYILHTSLSGGPSYQALSWVWGDQNVTEVILVNDTTTSIPANLLPALRAFRLELEPVLLWIDTLCIDQANTGERNHQVGLMKQIYSSAETVLAWLGPAVDGSTQSMKLLEENLHIPDRSLQDTTRVKKKSLDVLSRQWWTRMWVMQELLLARHALLCVGRDRVPWPKTAFTFLRPEFGLANLSRIQRLMLKRSGTLSILQMFMLLQDCACTDPRDRIFAILGLVDPLDAASNFADYSLSLQEVQTRLVMTSVENYGKLYVLSCAVGATFYEDVPVQNPSWTPVWGRSSSTWAVRSSERSSRFDLHYSMPLGLTMSDSIVTEQGATPFRPDQLNFRRFHASRNSAATITMRQGILLRGFVFDTIGEEIFHEVATWNHIRNCFDILDHDPQITLLLTHNRWSAKQDSDPCDSGCAKCIWDTFVGLHPIADASYVLTRTLFADSFDSLGTVYRWHRRNMYDVATCHRSLCSTSRGRLVLGPEYCKKGDLVCVLFGADVPFVLRRTVDAENETYLLVGEAYVDGCMDGQIMDELGTGMHQEREFELV